MSLEGYVVKYRKHPSYKGVDVYLAFDNFNGGVAVFNGQLDQASIMPLTRAIKESQNHPVVDKAHLVAQVVEIHYETSVVKIKELAPL